MSNSADAIAAAVRAALDARLADARDRERLYRRVVRHLPAADAREGSPVCPPMFSLRAARALGLADEVAIALAAAGAFFFSAADLADDCADGDAGDDLGRDLNDVCRLLFIHQQLLLALPGVPLDRRAGLAALFAEAGLEMADGQALDLAGTDALEAASPLRIAEGKAGGEFAAFLAAPALVAGRDPAPWRRYGRALGALVQILTDYLDLVLQPDGDDWTSAKPSLPLRRALAHPEHGPAVALLLAGERSAPERRAAGVWHVCQAGAAEWLADAAARYRDEMAAAAAEAGHPPVMDELRAELDEWVAGIHEALVEYAGDPRPEVPSLDEERARCRDAAERFLAADPALGGSVLVHRRGLFGRDEVVAGVYDRLLACEALGPGHRLFRPVMKSVLARLDRDGCRHFPGRPDVPLDADTAGLALAVAAGTRFARHPALGRSVERILAATGPDGICPAWLPDGRRFTPEAIAEGWPGGVCPGGAAHALLGLWRRDPRRHRAVVVAGCRSLAAMLAGEAPPPSSFHAPVMVDFLAVRTLATVAGEAGDEALRDAVGPALEAVGARLARRRTLAGRYGGVLETALAAIALARLGMLRDPAPVTRALVDAQHPDGGYAADPFHRRLPWRDDAWYGSRAVTTALVLRALDDLERCPAPGGEST